MGHAFIVPGADYRSNNLGTVTPSETLALQGIIIMGPSIAYVEQQYNALLVPTFTTQRAVTWSVVSGGSYASIDQNGKITVVPNLQSTSITIRCTSSIDSSIYAEKTISVSSTSLEYFDYITSDGTDFIVMPGLHNKTSGKVVVRCTLTGANTYVFMCQYASNSSQARLAAYNNSSNKVSALVGSKGNNNFVTKTADLIYRYEWTLGLNNTGEFTLYNDSTSTSLSSVTSGLVEMSGLVWIFRYGVGASSQDVPSNLDVSLTPSGAKFYGMTVYDTNNDKLAEYKPVRYNGVSGIYDTVSETFRRGYLNTGGLSVGND